MVSSTPRRLEDEGDTAWIVNLAGCFAIAALMQAALALGWPATTRAALTIGFIGGLTTYSRFNYETLRLIEEGAPA